MTPKIIDWAAFDLLRHVKLFANTEIPQTVLQIVKITNWNRSQKCQATNCVARKLRKLVLVLFWHWHFISVAYTFLFFIFLSFQRFTFF